VILFPLRGRGKSISNPFVGRPHLFVSRVVRSRAKSFGGGASRKENDNTSTWSGTMSGAHRPFSVPAVSERRKPNEWRERYERSRPKAAVISGEIRALRCVYDLVNLLLTCRADNPGDGSREQTLFKCRHETQSARIGLLLNVSRLINTRDLRVRTIPKRKTIGKMF